MPFPFRRVLTTNSDSFHKQNLVWVLVVVTQYAYNEVLKILMYLVSELYLPNI
jgi:hypothetical protein